MCPFYVELKRLFLPPEPTRGHLRGLNFEKIFWGSMPPDPPIESTHYVCATTPSLTYWPDHLKVASSVPEAALLQQFLARKNDHYRPLYLWQSHKYT